MKIGDPGIAGVVDIRWEPLHAYFREEPADSLEPLVIDRYCHDRELQAAAVRRHLIVLSAAAFPAGRHHRLALLVFLDKTHR